MFRTRNFVRIVMSAALAGGLIWGGLALAGLLIAGLPAVAGTTERVSVASDGTQGNADSGRAGAFMARSAMSGDGRFVAFASGATNLVPNDKNRCEDVFVHDGLSGETTRVSVASDGRDANGMSWLPAMSADGRFVAFESEADLAAVPPGKIYVAIYVHDRVTRQTTLASIAPDGTALGYARFPSISADGRFVSFNTGDTGGIVYVRDLAKGQTTRVSVASDGTPANNAGSSALSGDGRYVTFRASATNLVPGDDNGVDDIFVHDRQTGQTTRVSVASDGTEGNGASQHPAISADGRFVAFQSHASNLVPDDDNGEADVFVHDCQTGETTRVSLGTGGEQANRMSDLPMLSADARFVSFSSLAPNLVPDDTNGCWDIFVRDRQTGETTRVNVASDGTEAVCDPASAYTVSSISSDGRFVAFSSFASNLVPGDTNGFSDMFVHDRLGLAAPLQVTTSSLPDGVVGTAYSATLAATGGTEPYGWFLAEGALPDGLTLGLSGVISGTPTTEGTFTFTVQVEDSSEPAQDSTQVLSITVTAVAPPGITVVSVVAADIRQGGKYNITANVKNETAGPLTLTVRCTVEDAQGHVQELAPRSVSLASGSTAPVKFSDTSSLPKGTYTATVTVDGYPDVGDSNWDTFLIK